MIKYKKEFLNEIKKLLLYLIEFSENRFIILKKYFKDYIIDKLNRQPIIMIIYNENTFLANNGQKRIWTLDGYSILRAKNRRKSIIVSDFLLL